MDASLPGNLGAPTPKWRRSLYIFTKYTTYLALTGELWVSFVTIWWQLTMFKWHRTLYVLHQIYSTWRNLDNLLNIEPHRGMGLLIDTIIVAFSCFILMNMDKYFMWIHYERLHNHNKAKHNKTVCIFLGIYCRWHSGADMNPLSSVIWSLWTFLLLNENSHEHVYLQWWIHRWGQPTADGLSFNVHWQNASQWRKQYVLTRVSTSFKTVDSINADRRTRRRVDNSRLCRLKAWQNYRHKEYSSLSSTSPPKDW